MSDPFPVPDDDERLLAQCRVETFRSGGAGGQHRDTTDSAVRLVHEPTGVRASAQDERSQHRNKQLALRRLRDRLERRNRTEKPRRPTRVSARQKRKRVEEKRRRGRLKRLRKPPRRDPE